YLQVTDETISFFMNNFVDHVNGEIYENRLRRGGIAWNEDKGNPNKAGYHSIETAYYTYLYGNFFLKNEPVTLYYDFAPYNSERTYTLSPVEIPSSEYKIKEITYNGVQYTNFDPLAHTINLNPGVGGVFKAVFELTAPSAIADNKTLPADFSLNQNYPNPFNPSTRISYTLPFESKIKLSVYNMLGELVTTLFEGIQQQGNHETLFDGSRLSSGIYICRIEASNNTEKNNFNSAIKMILIK
ncbi:MAG: T9SS type A sorting domain-containing protein, partial [Methanococcaceae archaeon]